MTKFDKNLILVGGGGFALEIYTYLLEEISNQTLTDLTIKGVLDKSSNCELLEKHPELQYLGDIDEYVREDRGPKLPPKSDPDPEDPNDPEPEGKFEDVSKEELAEEDRRELEQLRAEKIAKNVPPVIENQKSYSEMMEEELEPRPEPKPVEDGFDPAEVEGYEEFNKKYDEPTPEEEAKKDEEEMRKALEEIDVEEEAKDLDKWNKWVKAAEEEVAKEDAKKEETISDKEFPDTKNRIFYGEEVKQIDEAQKKTVKGTNYITKVSNKQLRQTTNPEDSDPTSQK